MCFDRLPLLDDVCAQPGYGHGNCFFNPRGECLASGDDAVELGRDFGGGEGGYSVGSAISGCSAGLRMKEGAWCGCGSVCISGGSSAAGGGSHMDTIILGRVGGWTDGGGVDELVRGWRRWTTRTGGSCTDK